MGSNVHEQDVSRQKVGSHRRVRRLARWKGKPKFGRHGASVIRCEAALMLMECDSGAQALFLPHLRIRQQRQ